MSLLKPSEEVVYTEVESEVVMMHPHDGSYFGLNPVGAELWLLLEEAPMSTDDLAGYLKQTYDLTDEVAHADASAFVEHMLAEKFLVPAE